MKKYYCITVLALIVVTLLQVYNMSLQHKNYILNETDKINSVLRIAIDEEYAIRAHKNKHSHNDGKQRVYYKSMTEEDFLKAKPKKEDIIDFAEINIQNLRDNDIAETEAEAMGLLSKDILTTKGVTALIAKHLIISPKMGLFYCAKPLKMGEMWCVLVGLGAKISKFSANFQLDLWQNLVFA